MNILVIKCSPDVAKLLGARPAETGSIGLPCINLMTEIFVWGHDNSKWAWPIIKDQ